MSWPFIKKDKKKKKSQTSDNKEDDRWTNITSCPTHRTSETRFENKLGHVLIGSHCDCN